MNASLPARLPDRRHLIHPLKLDVTSAARLVTPNGEEVWCQTDTLSRKELAVFCGEEELRLLIPKRHLGPGEARPLSLELHLPQSPEFNAQLFNANVLIQGTRRIAKDRFMILLQFNELSLPQHVVLESYINHRKRSLGNQSGEKSKR